MLKTFLILLSFVFLSSLYFSSCKKVEKAEDTAVAQSVNVQKVTLDIQGMTCYGCEFNVESAIKKITGVSNVEADFATHSALVKYDPQQSNVEHFIEALNRIGYKGSKSSLN